MKPFSLLGLLLAGVLLSILLSGCAHTPKPLLTPKPALTEDWQKHTRQLVKLNKWQAVGKLAVKVPNDGGSMGLRWQQEPHQFNIDFSGPFGQNLLAISGNDQHVTLTEPNQAPITAKTAEELIRRNTGWTIPVAQLAFWVRGLPDPSTKISTFQPNAQGLIETLEQSGWKISYSEYMSVTSGAETLAMPKRIIAEFNDIRLTLAIREWQLEPVL
jgi:outer membrane lipoprotein LolB